MFRTIALTGFAALVAASTISFAPPARAQIGNIFSDPPLRPPGAIPRGNQQQPPPPDDEEEVPELPRGRLLPTPNRPPPGRVRRRRAASSRNRWRHRRVPLSFLRIPSRALRCSRRSRVGLKGPAVGQHAARREPVASGTTSTQRRAAIAGDLAAGRRRGRPRRLGAAARRRADHADRRRPRRGDDHRSGRGGAAPTAPVLLQAAGSAPTAVPSRCRSTHPNTSPTAGCCDPLFAPRKMEAHEGRVAALRPADRRARRSTGLRLHRRLRLSRCRRPSS